MVKGRPMEYAIDEKNLERQRLLAHLLAHAAGPHLEHVAPRRSGRWLDIGCGLGETTKLLTRFMAMDGECIGIDQDLALLEVARMQDWAGRRVSFQQGDATDLPFDDKTFDFVFTRYCLMHLSNPVKAIREMLRVTKPGVRSSRRSQISTSPVVILRVLHTNVIWRCWLR
jgi:ubiquinone/menaquinone biosynthesis C-methylase UbiE